MQSVQKGLARFRLEVWLIGAGIVSGVLYWKVATMQAANGTPVLYFLASFLLLFLIYAGTALFVSHREKKARSPSIWWILLFALLFRLILIPAGLRPDLSWDRALLEDLRGTQVNYEPFLLYDQDIWRYLWEGRVWAAGENPYLLAPGDPGLDQVVEWRAGEEDVWYEIRERVTFPELSTLYPPLTQLLFRMLDRVASPSVAAWKLVLILIEGLAVGLVALAARRLARPMALTLFLLCWNPLLVKSFAGSAHYDVLIVLTMAVAAYWFVSDRPLLGYLAIGLATLSKFVPLVVVTVLKPMRWRGLLLLAAVVALGYLPVVDTLSENFTSTGQTFVRYWRFNSGPYLLAETLIGTWGAYVAYIGLVGASILLLRLRVGEGIEDQLSSMLWILGLSIVLSPVVNPWYLTWLLPLAALTASTTWLAFSGIVFCAFFVMYDGIERSWILVIEYLALAGAMALEYSNRKEDQYAGDSIHDSAGP